MVAEVVGDGETEMTCDKCNEVVYRTRFIGGKWIGVDCNCVQEARIQSCVNPYGDLTLQHVHGDDGKPVRVTSSRQLSEAEKRYNFSSVARNMDSKNFDAPPQARVSTVADHYKRKFAMGRG